MRPAARLRTPKKKLDACGSLSRASSALHTTALAVRPERHHADNSTCVGSTRLGDPHWKTSRCPPPSAEPSRSPGSCGCGYGSRGGGRGGGNATMTSRSPARFSISAVTLTTPWPLSFVGRAVFPSHDPSRLPVITGSGAFAHAGCSLYNGLQPEANIT